MRNRIFSLLAIILCGIFLLGGLLIVDAVDISKKPESVVENNGDKDTIPKVSGTTYYVDAAAELGNDGLSQENALKTLDEVNALKLEPGDQVLFKRDCKWNGGLVIQASGTEKAPISFDAYGEGANLPVLNGNGQVNATISGVDVSYITIQNLEIMNTSDRLNYLRGIFINALNENVVGIKILNNYVHDVESNYIRATMRELYNVGNAYQDYHWQGGIIVRAGGYAVPEEKVILDDILVEGNRVEEVAVDGIVVGSVTKNWEKSTNVIIRNNYVKRAAGDGILLFSAYGGLIEGNTCEKNGWSGNIDFDTGERNFVGIFLIYCTKTTIQYNEVFEQYPCADDGQAFDADDTCVDTLIQYNYSHDNYNGFLLLFNMNNNGHAVVRYNVSQNDGGPFVTFSCKDSNYPMVATAEIYNNTCYTSKQITEMIEIAPNKDMRNAVNKRLVLEVENNIFCNKGTKNLSVLNNDTYYAYMTFSNNCWYGFSERTLPKNEPNQIIGDPMLCYPGSASVGFDTAFGYKLLNDSPCLSVGKEIYNDGGLDFYGNQVADVMNIGAYVGEGVKKPSGVNLALGQSVEMSSLNAIAMLRNATLVKVTDGSGAESVSTQPTDDANAETWYEVELGDDYDVKKVVLKTAEDTSLFPMSFTVEVWDGTAWKEVASKKDIDNPEANSSVELKFKAATGSKVRINVTEMRENSAGKYAAELAEIEVYE